MQIIEIDNIGVQPAQALFAGLLHILRPAVYSSLTVPIHDSAFTGEDEFVTAGGKYLADQGLVVAEAIQASGVQKGVADIQRPVQRSFRLLTIRFSVGLRHAHAAQAQG